MGTPLMDAQFVRLLDNRLRSVAEGEFEFLPTMIPTLYDVMESESAWEEFFEVGDLPDIPEFNGSLSTLSISPGYYNKIEHKEYAAKVQIQRKLIDDKKYGVLDNMAKRLGNSAQRTREKHAAGTFAYAFSTSFDYQQSEENLSLCNDSHTTKSGTSTSSGFDNSGTTALSKTAVAAARIAMKQFRTDISERFNMPEDFALVVPDNLVESAWEIINSPKGYDSANHTMNFHYNRYDLIPYSLLDDYDTNNWFLVSKSLMKRYLKWFDRINPEYKTMVDFNTFLTETSCYMRHSYGFTNWRWIYGSNVSG